MPFQKIQSERLADAIVQQIELLILRGVLRPGERLPSERDLAERMGVSRPSLREALAELHSRGLLSSRQGSGVYVDDAVGQGFSPALTRLFSGHREAVFDLIAFRRDLEGLAVERAASEGSATDLAVVDATLARMEAAHSKGDPAEEARLDAAFHMAIVEASHNTVALHVMRAMVGLLQEGVVYNRQAVFQQSTKTRDALLDQHRAINSALQSRDGAGARAALARHLDYVEAAILAQGKAAANEAIAQQRLTQEQARRG